ncbi:hydroxyacylglutathione hydrolase [Methylobrevis albus]|uniref:Hydroxyacylglutathione hydrolase n=1 Tax=Methylobrevis albus TaxID=2793297 RepID=A0A931I353_9HYPH|nr:hydroxyacylglutathione hydrolase [Methylobrevis albus]MBH0238041.1 hydroxyacylglutathione hydrolase [Methylobrevis albus]
MPDVEIAVIPCLSDNYAVLVHRPDGGGTLLVDAPEEAPIAAELAARGWQLTDILITHHHHDHVGGLAALKAASGARVLGPAAEASRIAGLDGTLGDGETATVAGLAVTALATPGHTAGHLSYHLPEIAAVFTGDTLFALGCGRLFEGTPADMWASLLRLAALPPETAVYCGHEYTLSNARFALGIDPGNAALVARAAEVEAARAAGRPTIPSTIGAEIATNPFLRAGEPAIAAQVGLAGHPAVAVFAEIRERKNRG